VIADVIFLHERGVYNTLYFATYFISLMVGPIVGGAMAENVGWRNFWWLNVALNAVALLCCVFLFPETRFHRPMGYAEGKKLTTGDRPKNGGEKIERADGKGVTAVVNENGITDIITDDTEKALDQQLSPTPSSALFLGHGRPSRQQWAPWQPFLGNLLTEFLLPWKLLLFPIVALAAFTVSWSASAFLTLNLTQSQVFAAPPYNFSSQTVGFFNFATLAGALAGLCTAGPLSDYVAEVLTRRNGGVREPEMRLLAAVPYVAVMIVGNVVVAVGYEKKWPWEVSLLARTRDETRWTLTSGLGYCDTGL
jgi:MFS family permease